MKTILSILLVLASLHHFAQAEQYKTCSPILLGYENDTVFKANCGKAIAILNTSSEELKIEIFKDYITDNHPRVKAIFQDLEGNITIYAKLEDNIFDISNNSPSDHPIEGFATLTINGISNEVAITYQVHGLIAAVYRTSGSLITQSKITLNLFFNPADFDVKSETKLSNPVEIEIFEGELNEKN